MTIKEAYSVLNIHTGESLRDIRRKYLRLMKESHPDNKNNQARIDARLLNEAYHLVLSSAPEALPAEAEKWDADIILQAFCDRVVYFQHIFDDGMVHQIPMAKGKYLWNPDAEEFPMLLKSVYEAAHAITKKENPAIFHYLMQEFIDPVYALEHMPKPWVFPCKLTPSLKQGEIIYASSRLYACADDGKRCEISFQDKSLHYIIAPLVQAKAAAVRLGDGRIQVSLTEKTFIRDYAGMNARINELRGRVP